MRGRAARLIAPLVRPPGAILALLVVAQWACVAIFAATVRHNGWLYYQGGDQLEYYTAAWGLADLRVAPAPIGYGWSWLLSPFALVFGPNLLDALPAIVVFQVGVLGPVALLCVYGIASRIGGRLLGYAAAASWVAVPFVAIPLFDQRYHERYVELFLPQALGLTALADYPSTVALLLAAFLCVRSLQTRAPVDGLLAGLTAGFAAAMKPSNLLFLAAPAAAYALARRWRPALAFGAAVLPSLLVLALWKYRTLGEIPLLSLGETRVAAGTGPPLGGGSFAGIDWGHLRNNEKGIREYFWSARLLEYLPLAGAVAVARRSSVLAGLLLVWFLAFLVVKGSAAQASLNTESFFRLLMPAFPAFLLLASALPLLLPRVGGWIASLGRESRPARVGTRPLAALLVAAVALPLVVIAAAPKASFASVVPDQSANLVWPVVDLAVSARARGEAVEVAWRTPSTRAATFARVYRLPEGRCNPSVPCFFSTAEVATSRDGTAVDRPGPGAWTYRVGIAANWRDDEALGDVYVLSGPVAVTVR
jgi:hypothetical protein